ncbi:hypothetical protein J4E93_010319 [Alternaria ventricosa]|uniref:uncharacterized protein n=1 Tax=Alternaria ventricosa TaxID=1187951 RepID=UPI0020C55C5A|nr:uncharacterized protein J4E93_010319 [Alternaria ventricosa]KAI4638163.1 hypothetical protein J4E93_010319 [Alternaria ventricosa]
MRLRITPGVTIALVALVIGRHIDSPVTTRTFGIDSSDAPPQFSTPEFSPPEFNAPEFAPPALAPRTDGGDFNPGNWADDAKWQKYLDKGHHLTCLMDATDRGAGWLSKDTRQPPSAASKWTGELRAEIPLWGWHEADIDKGWDADFTAMGLRTAFEGHGLDSQPKFDDEGDRLHGSNECFKITHYDETLRLYPNNPNNYEMVYAKDQKYWVGGKEYSGTAAFYEFTVNIGANGGGLMAQNIESPSHAVRGMMGWGRPANPGELPELGIASDIFWGFWARDNPNIKNFRMYAAQHIINPDTCLLVARAMKNKGVKKLSPWPASPIGATAAYFLATHKADLGIKRISKVTVVTNVKSPSSNRRLDYNMHLFFAIEDVPQDAITEPSEEGAVAKRETGRIDSKLISVRNNGTNLVRMHSMMA